jgi:cation:H+ antiporter
VDYLQLIAGLTLLWVATDIAISGATSIARYFKLSEFIIGIAILSIGSDLPELTIAIDAGLRGLRGADMSGVVVGSAIGSSLGQIGLVLGIVGMIGFVALSRRVALLHGSVMLGSLLLLGALGLDGAITRTEGFALLVAYAAYFAFLLADRRSYDDDADGHESVPIMRAIPLLVVGMAGVILGAELTVLAVTDLAVALQIDQTIIAVIIVGIGTSLPELSISVSAMIKRRGSLSVGNLVGSNIFDTLVPIGAAAAISGLDFDGGMLFFDLPFLFLLSATALFFLLGKRGLQRPQALVMLALYILYVIVRLGRA